MKHFFTFCFVIVTAISACAQDIVVKTDKSEVKAKVLEIEEYRIKYKQWDFQEGPTYSINKNEVFMIIYKNGKRETFDTTPVTVSNNNSPSILKNYLHPQSTSTTQSANQSNFSISKINGGSDTLQNHVDYAPSRLSLTFNSISEASSGADAGGVGLNLDTDYRLLPNYINWGFNIFLNYSYAETSYFSSETVGYGLGVYGLGYMPVNRMLGKIDKQNTGFFPFIRAGYSYGNYSTSTDMDGSGSSESSAGAGGFGWSLGADYKFSEKFGLTIYTNKFSAFAFGINLQTSKK